MTTQPDLACLPVGSRVQCALLVAEVESRGGAAPHTILTLSNATGQIQSAPVWESNGPRIAGVGRGDAVQVTGEIDCYRDRRQLRIGSIRVLPRDQVDWRRLMPSVGDVGPYWRTLDGWRESIIAPRLGATLGLFFDDVEFRHRYQECPASLCGHHGELGGLLRHTVEVAAIAQAIARTCAADLDLVLAGVLLHDIGKLESYRWDGAFRMTESGALLGHVVLGSLMLERRLNQLDPPPCTDMERRLLHHLILAHHGRLEFGAPVHPMTLEAEVLHYADNASAKTASMSEALSNDDNFHGDETISTKSLWQLDRRRAYRGRSEWGRMVSTAGVPSGMTAEPQSGDMTDTGRGRLGG